MLSQAGIHTSNVGEKWIKMTRGLARGLNQSIMIAGTCRGMDFLFVCVVSPLFFLILDCYRCPGIHIVISRDSLALLEPSGRSPARYWRWNT